MALGLALFAEDPLRNEVSRRSDQSKSARDDSNETDRLPTWDEVRDEAAACLLSLRVRSIAGWSIE